MAYLMKSIGKEEVDWQGKGKFEAESSIPFIFIFAFLASFRIELVRKIFDRESHVFERRRGAELAQS